MRMYEVIFTWLAEHRRDPVYLADLCRMDPDRLAMLVCGHAVPTDHELAMLADATGVPVDDIQQDAETKTGVAAVNPATCYSASQVAELLSTSADTIYTMMADGRLYWVLVGEKLKRIPHFGLIAFLMGCDWDGQRGMSHPPSHVSPDSPAELPPQSRADAQHHPGVPPRRDGDDGAAPPPPRLF